MAYSQKVKDLYQNAKDAGEATSFKKWYAEYKQQATAEPVDVQQEPVETVEVAEGQQEPVETVEVAEGQQETVEKEENKAAKSRKIYDEMSQQAAQSGLELKRKDIIKRFVEELPISKVGAATYLQNIKTKLGLVKHPQQAQ